MSPRPRGRPRKTERKPRADGYVYLTVGPPGRGFEIAEHRWVLYLSIGGGPQVCFWCDRPIEWGGEGAAELVADHVNHLRDDNTPENIVAACMPCNMKRKTPHILRYRPRRSGRGGVFR